MSPESVLLTKIVADNAQFKRTLDDSLKAARSFGDKLAYTLDHAKRILTGGVAGRQLFDEFVEGYESLDKMVTSADKLGISSKNFQYLEYAAKRSDVEIGNLEIALKKLRVSLSDNKKAPLFEELGLSQAKLKTMETSEALSLLYDSMSKLNEYDKIKFGTKLSGRSFQDTIALAREGFKGFRKELDDLGGPVDTSNFSKLDEAVDKLTTKYANLKKELFLNAGGPLIAATAFTLSTAQKIGSIAASPIKKPTSIIENSLLENAAPKVFSAGLTPMTETQKTTYKYFELMPSIMDKANQSIFNLGDASAAASAALKSFSEASAMNDLKNTLGLNGQGGKEYLDSILTPITEIQDENFTKLANTIRNEISDGSNLNGVRIQSALASLKGIANSYNGAGEGQTNAGMRNAYELLMSQVTAAKNAQGQASSVLEIKVDENGMMKVFASSSETMKIVGDVVVSTVSREASSIMASGG